MKLKVLGSSGAEFPDFHPPAFLIDDALLMDAGTIGAVLDERAQWKIRNILLTHAHLDHIRGIPFLADNIIVKNMQHGVAILSIPSVLKTLKDNLFNNRVWPDFTALPDKENPVLTLKAIRAGRPFKVNSYEITAYLVDHAVPATGYVIRDAKGSSLLYTGDTGPTEAIWRATKEPIDCAIIEVSMPNSMRDMAIMTGHLTAELLMAEVQKMHTVPSMVLITHPKPQYLKRITAEVKKLPVKNIRLLRDGDEFRV